MSRFSTDDEAFTTQLTGIVPRRARLLEVGDHVFTSHAVGVITEIAYTHARGQETTTRFTVKTRPTIDVYRRPDELQRVTVNHEATRFYRRCQCGCDQSYELL